DGPRVSLAMDLPAALVGRDDLFESTAPALSQAVSAGMFGTGFTLRLARAEARATRGDLCREGDTLLLTLPLVGAASAEIGNYEVDLRGQIAETG
ncbi:MAG TPA: hypothetical protein VEZ26_01600, partial [Sphingomonadaceae bacterium]|nr:hypothetical protein [Sphingomonadaceae bacterium]